MTATGQPSESYERGMKVRREVLGDAHVDRASQNVTPFDARFQRWITEAAWAGVWDDPTLDLAVAGDMRPRAWIQMHSDRWP